MSFKEQSESLSICHLHFHWPEQGRRMWNCCISSGSENWTVFLEITKVWLGISQTNPQNGDLPSRENKSASRCSYFSRQSVLASIYVVGGCKRLILYFLLRSFFPIPFPYHVHVHFCHHWMLDVVVSVHYHILRCICYLSVLLHPTVQVPAPSWSLLPRRTCITAWWEPLAALSEHWVGKILWWSRLDCVHIYSPYPKSKSWRCLCLSQEHFLTWMVDPVCRAHGRWSGKRDYGWKSASVSVWNF